MVNTVGYKIGQVREEHMFRTSDDQVFDNRQKAEAHQAEVNLASWFASVGAGIDEDQAKCLAEAASKDTEYLAAQLNAIELGEL